MRGLVLAVVLVALASGCVQPRPDAMTQPIPITIHAEVPHGYVGFLYSLGNNQTEMAQTIRAKMAHTPTPADPGCIIATSRFAPDCGGREVLQSYRVPRDVNGSVNIMDIAGNVYPLGSDGTVVLLFADPAEIFFAMAGPASQDFPSAREQNGGVGCFSYKAREVLGLAGDAEVTTTPTSAPKIRFWGPAELQLAWDTMPSACA
jgi:hypothetical protein